MRKDGEMVEPIKGDLAIVVGIDPDTDKSGVAAWRSYDKSYALHNLKFFELFEYLQNNKAIIRLVVVEAGWLNDSVWHGAGNKRSCVAARIGKNVGCNHETGRKIVEMCEYLKLHYEVVRPRNSKISHKEFGALTGIQERTNQEQRDAFMLVFGRS